MPDIVELDAFDDRDDVDRAARVALLSDEQLRYAHAELSSRDIRAELWLRAIAHEMARRGLARDAQATRA